jgi:hypothetical protein
VAELAFACCPHCEHTDHETDPCGQHDTPCDHGCNDFEIPDEVLDA